MAQILESEVNMHESNLIVEAYLGGRLIFSGDEYELMDLTPEWNGKICIGDLVTVNGQEKRITQLIQWSPDKRFDRTVLKMKLD